MKSNINAIRAVTAEFARQFIQPFVWVGLGLFILLLVIVGSLAFSLSLWWWLLLAPIALLGIAGTVVWLLVRFILNRVSPRLTSPQATATKEFVKKIQFTTETIQTPYPVIVMYVIRDIILRRDDGFISELSLHSKALKPDFEKLRRLF
ncbi:MAG TPA: hypothetical protein VGO98_01525 [Candidatus Saccharimonadales bacterium]|jgi:hypothetical protein|nr:hypothetical protein [Candidatus Saccharimonadales bacterium]